MPEAISPPDPPKKRFPLPQTPITIQGSPPLAHTPAPTPLKLPCVYILANAPRGVLYIGVTSNLTARVWQHRHRVVEGFTQKYNVHQLVWFERHDTMPDAIAREKQLKGGNRARKLALVEAFNPTWRDLSADLGGP